MPEVNERTPHQSAARERAFTFFGVAGVIAGAAAILAGLSIIPDTAALWIVGAALVVGCGGLYYLYDSKPIASETFDVPVLDLVQDEKWRDLAKRSYRVRYIEALIRDLADHESRMVTAYNKRVQAYNTLANPTGRIAHGRAKGEYFEQLRYIQHHAENAANLKHRIHLLYEGDFSAEVFDLKQEAEKINRDKVDVERTLREEEAKVSKCTKPRNECDKCKQWPDRKEELHGQIRSIDHRIIEINSFIAELQSYDVKKLQGDLGLGGPQRIATMPQQDLDDFTRKIHTVNNMPVIKSKKQAEEPTPSSRDEDIDRLAKAIATAEAEFAERITKERSIARRKQLENERDDMLKKLRSRKIELMTS